MLIPRKLAATIEEKLKESQKAVILYGPRQVGKTTLVKNIIKKLPFKTLIVNADEGKYIDVFSSKNLQKLQSVVSGYDLLFIDEAQRIPEIGLNLKILLESMPGLKVVATGSSSFDLANKVSEPLTGRAWSYTLYPIAFAELQETHTPFELSRQLEERLIYGSYPEIFSIKNREAKKEYLEQLSRSYLYKDILELHTIKHSSKVRDLLKLIAFQIGNEVSLTELASILGIGKGTVEHYIDLLEKSFVLFRLSGFSRNLRKEVSKMDKIYFYDLGIRNILIDNMQDINQRNDLGALWENFLVVERLKLLHYEKEPATPYFWRTYTGAELDYVEERAGSLFGYEFTYGNKTKKIPPSWIQAYPKAHFEVIRKINFLDFVSKIS